jgi:hypothetical protein
MRHATDATRGALLLRVRRDAATRALKRSARTGFTAHVEEVDP